MFTTLFILIAFFFSGDDPYNDVSGSRSSGTFSFSLSSENSDGRVSGIFSVNRVTKSIGRVSGIFSVGHVSELFSVIRVRELFLIIPIPELIQILE